MFAGSRLLMSARSEIALDLRKLNISQQTTLLEHVVYMYSQLCPFKSASYRRFLVLEYGVFDLNSSRSRHRALLAACFMLVPRLSFFSILNMKATCSSETQVDFQRTKLRYIPEEGNLHNHRRENLKSYTLHGVNEHKRECKYSKFYSLIVYFFSLLPLAPTWGLAPHFGA
jgi:hypothetical protein